jgi:geranyl-CoA carboxylase alpha subunit
MSRFKKVLIANRGEIAVRVMRTCKKLGIRTVAVYSDADREALHVAFADEAVHLGPSPAKESYLVAEKILAAAKKVGADAVHPGYGFLSENADFSRACREAGITFIGPSPEAVLLMGNKRLAKLRMIAAGVPCIPGYEGADQSDEVLLREASRIGLPIMVKAAAGGGGRGMRLVREESGLAEAIRSARSEAEGAFGSGELILEKAVIGARHVEIQVFADSFGQAIHLGERDCSVQRRHQKVVEESPSPALTPAIRAAMGEAATKAARAISYLGAGTLEFLLAPNGEFYFMEMNTRLQVEHPVTESITGLDLVEWQLAVASGEKLPLAQDEVRFAGHAIEVRLCAEDPSRDFLPCTGKVLEWDSAENRGVRVDHGVRLGGEVSPFYDSMVAKVIAHGTDREDARRKLVGALTELRLLGIPTNKAFLLDVLDHPDFVSGAYDTSFVPTHYPKERLARAAVPEPSEVLVAAAALYDDDALALADSCGLSSSLSGWNSAYAYPVTVRLAPANGEGAEHVVSLRALAERTYEVSRVAEDGSLEAPTSFELARDGKKLRVTRVADGVTEALVFAREPGREHGEDTLHLDFGRRVHSFRDVTLRVREAAEGTGDARVMAPMDGKVLRVETQVGALVEKGQLLVVLEAMKMEFSLVAGRAGTVAEVRVSAGGQVSAKQVLVLLEGT